MSEEQYEKAAAIKSELDNLKRMICESYLAKYIRIHKITVKKNTLLAKSKMTLCLMYLKSCQMQLQK